MSDKSEFIIHILAQKYGVTATAIEEAIAGDTATFKEEMGDIILNQIEVIQGKGDDIIAFLAGEFR